MSIAQCAQRCRNRTPIPYTNRTPIPYTNRTPIPYTNRTPIPYTNRREFRFKRRRVVVGGRLQQWQADLVDLPNFKNYNDGTTFLLTVIDVFSKVAWYVPLKNKSAASLVTVLKSTFTKGSPQYRHGSVAGECEESSVAAPVRSRR